MDLVTHGGKCCGIKTIRSFPELPTSLLPARAAVGSIQVNGHPDIQSVSSNVAKTFHRAELPSESGADRLDRLIAYVRKHRPSHMIEAVVNHFQLPHWKGTLRSRGFRLVSSYTNSNTSARIYVFHKIIKNGEDVSAEDAVKLLKGV